MRVTSLTFGVTSRNSELLISTGTSGTVTWVAGDGRLITTSGFHEDMIVSSRQSLLKAALLVAARFGKK